jgi:penicillin-binding protein 1C
MASFRNLVLKNPGSAIAVLIASISVLLWRATAPAFPSFAEVRARWHPSDIQLLDRHGEPLYQMRIDRRGRRLVWTRLDETSPALRRALIQSEDRRFYSHHGVDAIATASTALRWITGRHVRGTSTITMQLAALLDPSLARGDHRRSIIQKLRQMRAAIALDSVWSKEQIF